MSGQMPGLRVYKAQPTPDEVQVLGGNRHSLRACVLRDALKPVAVMRRYLVMPVTTIITSY